MKVKLQILLLIVLLSSCAKKTYNKDYYHYKNKISETTTEELQIKESQYLSVEEKKKFANIIGTSVNEITNEKLYHIINQWLGTPYLWGGTTKKGVDCSSLVQQVYKTVYIHKLPRTSIEQFYLYTDKHFLNQKYLKEGDLIFFRLRHKDKVVSHVGIYLKNGKFLGSNSPRGVEIANLNSVYWQDKYVASARVLNQ